MLFPKVTTGPSTFGDIAVTWLTHGGALQQIPQNHERKGKKSLDLILCVRPLQAG
jgi:hypothetical protein